ncbi:hypothetical protein ACFLSV_06325, partial [Bacteroidota bacterium]
SSKSIHKKHIEKIEGGFFGKILGNRRNPWLIPAIGFTVVLFFIFTVVYINVKQNNLNITGEQTKEEKQLTTDESKTQTPGSKKESTDAEKEKLPGKEITEDFSVKGGYEDQSPISTKRGLTEHDAFREELPKSVEEESKEGVLLDKMEQKFAEPDKDVEETTGNESETLKTETQRVEKKVSKFEPEKEKKNVVSEEKTDDKRKSKKDEKEIEQSVKGLNEIDKSDLERIQEEIENK